MGLGGPNLVKGATGQTHRPETLGGARMHTTVSGVAHYLARNDEPLSHDDSRAVPAVCPNLRRHRPAVAPAKNPSELYGMLPADHRQPYAMEEVLLRSSMGDHPEFQRIRARNAVRERAVERPSGGGHRQSPRFSEDADGRPRIGGIVYTESARKVAYFVEQAERAGTPMIYVQDVSGFMVGIDAESSGIIRAGAEMVETMSCATVPKIVLTVNHASGAGYYAMAGQGFDPNFTFGWPTARIGVMEGDSAVQALFSVELPK